MSGIDFGTRWITLLVIVVSILSIVFISGMVLFENGQNPSGPQGSRPLDGIAFSPTEINASSNGTTVMTVRVSVRIGSDLEESAPFENVHLCAYNRNLDVIESTNLGTVSTDWQSVETIRTFERPYYSFIHHPDFRKLKGEYQMLKYNDEFDRWMSSGVNEIPFEFSEMNWTGCRPPA